MKRIFKNFSYLLSLQVFNLLIPLLTYPYLIKVLGTDVYGQFIYQQGIASIFAVFISYGFDLTGTKIIAERKNDAELSSVFFSILAVRLIIASLVVPIFFLIIYYQSGFLYALFFLGFFGDKILFPLWYFQGLERMGYIALVNSVAKLLTLVMIFTLVKDLSDLNFLPLIYSTSSTFIAIVGLFFAIKIKSIKFHLPTPSEIKHYINIGFDYFYSSIFISIKDRGNIVLIGHLFSGHYVVVYDLAMKLTGILAMPIGIINNVVYPKVVQQKNIKIVYGTIVSCLIYSVLSYMLLTTIVYFLDLSFVGIEPKDKLYLYWFLFIPILLSLSQSISRNFLNAFNFRVEYMRSITYVGVYYLFFVVMILFLSNISFFVFVKSVISIYIVETMIRLYYFTSKLQKIKDEKHV